MRSSGIKGAGLLAAAQTAALSAGIFNVPTDRIGTSTAYKPTPPRLDTALAREIAEHNSAVDAKKAARLAARAARRT